MKTCAHCGSTNTDTNRFCLNCGNLLDYNPNQQSFNPNQLALSWRENGIEKNRSIEINHPTNKKAGTICIGRDPDLCDIFLGDPKVSRVHAQIIFDSYKNQYLIENLRENNPIFVNNQKLIRGSKLLSNGATITLGDTQIRFTHRDLTPQSPQTYATQINVPVQQNANSTLSLTMLLPFISTRKDFRQQPYFIPGIITIIWVILLLASLGNTKLFNFLFGSFLGLAGFYFIYQLCGKRKPLWLLIIPIIATPVLLVTPVWTVLAIVFRDILPGNLSEENTGLISTFIAHFFGAGLAEELLKALPLFGLMLFSQWFNAAKLGIKDPLDGIIFGAGSGLGFTLVETLLQYVPLAAQSGEVYGLQLLIIRIVASVFGHMAYSGYFGYYIGLSVLKPKRSWSILLTGYLIASTTHALWNTSGLLGTWALGLAGILAYCLLIGAILRAKKIA